MVFPSLLRSGGALLAPFLFWIAVVPSGAEPPPTTASPVESIEAIRKDLQGLNVLLSSPNPKLLDAFKNLDKTVSVADRFWLVYQKSLSDYPESESLKPLARRVLETWKTLKNSRDWDYIARDSFEVGEITLLGLAGETDAAVDKVTKVSPGGDCGNWIATIYFEAYAHGASILERAGDYKKAADFMKRAEGEKDLVLGGYDEAEFEAHLGYLLLRSGDTEKAVQQYQMVADLFPETRAAEYSAAALERLGALKPPSVARILDGYPDLFYKAVRALVVHKLPETEAEFLDRFAKASDDKKYDLAEGLSDLSSKKALPLFRAELLKPQGQLDPYRRSSLDNVFFEALVNGGYTDHVEPYLKLVATYQDRPNLFKVDQVLARRFHRPVPTNYEARKAVVDNPAAFAADWLNWIQTHPAETQDS